MGLIARGGTSSFGPTDGTTFEHNTVWLDGPDSQAVVCHASCPASTVIRANILVAVRNSLWMDSAGWTEEQNVLKITVECDGVNRIGVDEKNGH